MPRLEPLEERATPTQVNTLGDPSIAAGVNNDGTIVGTDGTISLRSAITAANARGADSITFAPGLYGGTTNLTGTLPTFRVNIFIGAPASSPITVLGSFNFRLIETAAGTDDEIDNLELEQGGGVDSGGGILNAGSLKLSGCYMTSCSANTGGGAIYNAGAGATLTLENTTLYQNSAGWGGAIFNSNGEVDIYSGSVIDTNTVTGSGGGIWNDSGTLTITGGSVVKNNKAPSGSGGGIYNFGGTVSMTAASLTNNTAGDRGGGLFNDGTANMTSVDIEYNSASTKGGGFYLLTGSLTLTYSTLSNNLAPLGAGNGGAYKTGSASFTDNGGNTITDQVVPDP